MAYTAQDYKKGQPRWCPGCGDHFFLASLHKAMAEIGVAPKDQPSASLYGYLRHEHHSRTCCRDCYRRKGG